MTTTEQPQDTQPQTALDLWNEQVQGLADPAHAESAIGFIYDQLMGLHEKLMSNGNDKAAAKVADAYNHALELYNTTTQQGIVITGGAAAITAAIEQREQAVTELKMLLDSIEKGDEAHPKLADYAAAIREDEHEDTLNDPYLNDALYEDAREYAAEVMYEEVMGAWDVESWVVDRLMNFFNGDTEGTPEQRDLMKQLINSFSKDRPSYLPPVAHPSTIEDDEDPDADGDE